MPIIIPDNLPYTPRGVECLRFGARRGGEGIGCCAVDVMQGFNNDPDAKCPQQPFFDGDSWFPVEHDDGGQLCVGGDDITNEQVFLSYLTHGSFTPEPAADHGFIIILSGDQIHSSVGQKWMKILKREGFEWVGCVSNSVYAECHPNHIFMLLRNTHNYMEDEEIESLQHPPEFWSALPEASQTPEERYRDLVYKWGTAHTRLEEEAELA